MEFFGGGKYLEKQDKIKRSVFCGAVSKAHLGKTITLCGWVQRRRDHGGLIFVDLRDRYGIVQLVFDPEQQKDVHNLAHSLRNEFVVAVTGEVSERPEGTENPEIPSGEVEVRVAWLKVLNESAVPPFLIEDETDAGEELRLKHRYLDLRRTPLQRNLALRHKVALATRNYLSDEGFLEVETPILTKSTPEGARDFLVPSRLNAAHFYALPQSPQLFKQILMIAGLDRYFQIVKCFRDEDLRADRQPEFTQIDVEMSFVDAEDVIKCMEGLMVHVFNESLGVELSAPFERLTYEQAVGRYGLDAPDVRFGLELVELTDVVKNSEFKVFADVAKGGGIIKAINAKGCSSFTRKEIDELTELCATYGGKGLAWVKVGSGDERWQSPIAKFFKDEEKAAIEKLVEAEEGDLILFSADKPGVVNTVLGRIRLELGKRLSLIPTEGFSFVWITDFPMFEYDDTDKRYYAVHHPFTAPVDEDVANLKADPGSVKTKAYDLVLNGEEIGGGSIRIHDQKLQALVFEKLGIGDEQAGEKFGFLLDALSYGTPPHGGIAFGLDRILAIMTGSESIRDVIAFPKTQKAVCPLSEAPSEVDSKQLEELFLRVLKKS